jgi:HAD superfamily hydrolase (TIGR01509 family)
LKVPWQEIDTVLLDMDGTLLDLHFDNYFWLEFVPGEYAKANRVTKEQAAKELLARYKKEEGTLNWTDLDFWSDELGLDIPTLKTEVDHLIQVHPFVERFLQFLLRSGKQSYLVTNAHGKTLDLKMKKTRLGPYFHGIISAHELGLPKEDSRFWKALDDKIGFDGNRTLLAEDSEANLKSAEEAGIRHLIFVARPSTRDPIRPSSSFPSIVYFNELVAEDM